MRPVSISFLLCFFALAVLGFAGASQAMDYNVTCVGDAAHGATCPGDSMAGGLGEALRHLSGLKLFSLGVSAGIFLLLASYYLILTVLPAEVKERSIGNASIFNYWSLGLRPVAIRKRSWLTLLEKRDPYNI